MLALKSEQLSVTLTAASHTDSLLVTGPYNALFCAVQLCALIYQHSPKGLNKPLEIGSPFGIMQTTLFKINYKRINVLPVAREREPISSSLIAS